VSSGALESGADDWKRSVLLSLSRLCGRVCIILLTRAQFLQNGPLADSKLDHSERETPADGYAVAPVPRAATRVPAIDAFSGQKVLERAAPNRRHEPMFAENCHDLFSIDCAFVQSSRQEFSMSNQMTPLRRRMIDDMMIRNLSPLKQKIYVRAVLNFSIFHG
jgi:hypothetical protein